MAASSSMIRMRAAGSVETLALLCGTRMPASDMRGFPCHGEFEVESSAAANLALDLDLAGVFLDNAVAHSQPQSCAPALTLAHRQLGSEEGVIDALHVFQRNARARIGNIHRYMPVGLRGYPQCTA